jgi:hypothetical protein
MPDPFRADKLEDRENLVELQPARLAENPRS